MLLIWMISTRLSKPLKGCIIRLGQEAALCQKGIFDFVGAELVQL